MLGLSMPAARIPTAAPPFCQFLFSIFLLTNCSNSGSITTNDINGGLEMSRTSTEFPRKIEELPRVQSLTWVLQLIKSETSASFQISQLDLLLTIMDQDGIPYPDLIKQTGLPASTVSRNVKDLFKRGLVEILVDPNDTRCHAAKLTKKGGELKRGIQQILSGNFRCPPKGGL